MLVSHKYKFIFIKTVKTGGTSTEIYLEQYCTDEDLPENHKRSCMMTEQGIIGSRCGRDEYFCHMKPFEIIEKIGRRTFNSYEKIGNIRNPYDLVVSHYYFFGQDSGLNFEDYVLTTNAVQRVSRSNKSLLFHNEKFILDKVIRQETLATDLKKICEELGLPPSKRTLSKYKESIGRKKRHYSTFYNDKTKAVVEEHFDYYFKLFDYKFESVKI